MNLGPPGMKQIAYQCATMLWWLQKLSSQVIPFKKNIFLHIKSGTRLFKVLLTLQYITSHTTWCNSVLFFTFSLHSQTWLDLIVPILMCKKKEGERECLCMCVCVCEKREALIEYARQGSINHSLRGGKSQTLKKIFGSEFLT